MDSEQWSRLSPEQQAEAWRQHAAQQGPPPGSQSPPVQGSTAPAVERKPKKPFYRKPGYIVLLALVVLVIVLIATSGNGGASSSSSASATSSAPPAPAHAITARDWQLIAKDPDAHKGESVIVYGEVTQFDAATGPTNLRANVDGVDHPVQDGFAVFPTNTILAGDQAALANVVQNDVFKADVTVLGSQSYDTQIGGHTTVPSLQIQSIQVTGHTS